MIQDQRSGENNEASNTVIIPVTAMARLLIAPSIRRVPSLWRFRSLGRRAKGEIFAIGCVMRKILQMSSPKMFPSTPGDDDHSYRDRHIAAKFLGNAHSDRGSD